MGTQAPLPKGRRRPGADPRFSAQGYCGRTAGWIKMALGMEGLGPVHTVLDGTQLPSPKQGQSPPNFRPSLSWPNGWMDEDAAWYGSRSRPRRHCTRRGPNSREKGHSSPLFLAHAYCGHGRPSQLLLSSCLRHSVVVGISHTLRR